MVSKRNLERGRVAREKELLEGQVHGCWIANEAVVEHGISDKGRNDLAGRGRRPQVLRDIEPQGGGVVEGRLLAVREDVFLQDSRCGLGLA